MTSDETDAQNPQEKEAMRIAEQYVYKHKDQLQGSEQEIRAAIKKVAEALEGKR